MISSVVTDEGVIVLNSLVVLSSLDVPDCDNPLYYLYHYISLDFGGNHSPRPSIYIWMVT